jgi:hypothetical protein
VRVTDVISDRRLSVVAPKCYEKLRLVILINYTSCFRDLVCCCQCEKHWRP